MKMRLGKMRLGRFALLTSSLLGGAGIPAAASTHVRHTAASAKPLIKHVAKPKFQTPRGIEDDRAVQLQTALVHSGYLTGQTSGHWDGTTEAAMQKLQADNGWQTKLVPDSRAIIKLGLGPSTAYSAGPSQPGPGPLSPIPAIQPSPLPASLPNSMSLQ